MRQPLLPITVAFAAGIAAAPYFFLSASQLIFWIAVVLLAAVIMLRFLRFFYGLVFAGLGFFICGTFLAAHEHSFLPTHHIESLARRQIFQAEEPSRIIGWARTPSIMRPGGEYFDFELNQVQQGDAVMAAVGRIRLYYYISAHQPAPLVVTYGTRLSIAMKNLRRPRNYMTDGVYDYEGLMQRQEIYFSGIVRHPEDMEILPGRDGSRWRGAMYALRTQLRSNIDRLFPPDRDRRSAGPILKAMLLGDENWLSPERVAAFQQNGVYHVLVVAGLHVGALAFGLLWALSWFHLPKWLETLVVSICVIAFTFLADARIPTVRATLMVLMYLAARFVYRERALLNSIAAAALLLLVFHPSDLRDAGFQFSFLAVLLIAAVALPLIEWGIRPYRLALRELDERERDALLAPRQTQFRQDVRTLLDYFCDPSRLARRPWRMLRKVIPLAAAGVLAFVEAVVAVAFTQAGLALAMTTYFHRVVWSGMAANLFVLPLTGFLIPFGLLVLLASLIWWPLAVAGAWAISPMMWLLQKAVDWSHYLPRFDRRVPGPPFWVSAAFLTLLFLIALLGSRRSRIVWFPIAAMIPMCVALTLASYHAQTTAGRLELTTLDVGQGDSLFITFPRGRTMLIDGGGAIPIPGEPPPRFDTGEQIVSPYLLSRYLKKIDYVILTHAHWDHLGGLLSVLRNFEVGELWIGLGPTDSGLEQLLQEAKSLGIPVVRQESGNKKEIDGVELLVLSPPADWSAERVSNNDSLVLRLSYGTRHILLSGDVEARMEKRLVDEELPIASDILKVPHHGSKTSSTTVFLKRVAPRFGIISVGAFSRFGHPNREVLDALQGNGIRTYRTDADGSITASTDGRRIELAAFRDGRRQWPTFQLYPAVMEPVWHHTPPGLLTANSR